MGRGRDLISRKALVEEINKLAVTSNPMQAWQKSLLLSVVGEAQTVDAVPVVRCKDCIGKEVWYKDDYGVNICGLSGLFVVEDNDYCSMGERK